jgi:hypothetical protein
MLEWFEGPPAKLLPVPYVSQKKEGALKFNNDCGAAAAAMLIRAYTDQGPTPDELFEQTGAETDRFLSAGEVMALLRSFDIRSEWQVDCKREDLFETLVTQRPLITLIKYGTLRDAGLTEDSFGGPHFATVVGMDTGYIYINDPLWEEEGGKHLAVPIHLFEQAWEEVGTDPEIPNPKRGAIIPLGKLGEKTSVAIMTVQVIAADGLNVRTGPGVRFQKVGALDQGEIVKIIEEHQGPNFRWGKTGERRWIALEFTVEAG